MSGEKYGGSGDNDSDKNGDDPATVGELLGNNTDALKEWRPETPKDANGNDANGNSQN